MRVASIVDKFQENRLGWLGHDIGTNEHKQLMESITFGRNNEKRKTWFDVSESDTLIITEV